MGSRGSSWEKPGASSEDEASPRPGSLRVTGTWYPHTFPWEQPMLQVTAMPDILGLQGGSCGRWCFQKGFSKKDPCKRGLGKRILPKGPLKQGLPKRPCKKNILQRACVSSPGIKVPRQWAVIQGEHPPMQIAGIKGYFIPNRGYQQSPETLPSLGTGCLPLWVWEPQQFPQGAPEAVHTQHPISKQREGGVVEDVGDKSWGPSRAV